MVEFICTCVVLFLFLFGSIKVYERWLQNRRNRQPKLPESLERYLNKVEGGSDVSDGR